MYDNEKKRRRRSDILKKFMRVTFSVFEGIDITVLSDREINVDGCIGIGEYTDETVTFIGKDMKLNVYGDDFELYTFAGGRIKASGKIRKIEYERDE